MRFLSLLLSLLLNFSYQLTYNGTVCGDSIDFSLIESTPVTYLDNSIIELLSTSTPYAIPIWSSTACKSAIRRFYCVDTFIAYAEDSGISPCDDICLNLNICDSLVDYVSNLYSVSPTDILLAWQLPIECTYSEDSNCVGNSQPLTAQSLDKPICPDPFLPSLQGYPLTQVNPSGCSIGCPDPFVLDKSEFESIIEIYLILASIGLTCSTVTFFVVRTTSSFEQKNHFFEFYCLSCLFMGASVIAVLHTNQAEIFCPTPQTYLNLTDACVRQGFIVSWTYIGSMWSAVFLVLDVFVKLVIGISKKRARNLRRFGFVFVYGLATACSLASFFTNSLGFDPLQSVPLCMHMITNHELVYIFGYAVPTLLATALVLYMTGHVMFRLTRIVNSQHDNAVRMVTELTTQKSFSVMERDVRDVDLSSLSEGSNSPSSPVLNHAISPSNSRKTRLASLMRYNMQPLGFLIFAIMTQWIISGIGIDWAVNGVSNNKERNEWTACVLINSISSLSSGLSVCGKIPRTGRSIWEIVLIGTVPAALGITPLLVYVPAVVIGFRRGWRLLSAWYRKATATTNVVEPDIFGAEPIDKSTIYSASPRTEFMRQASSRISDYQFDSKKEEVVGIFKKHSRNDSLGADAGFFVRLSIGAQEVLDTDLSPDLLDSDEAVAVPVVIDSDLPRAESPRAAGREDAETKKITTRFLRRVTAVGTIDGLDANSIDRKQEVELTVVRSNKRPSIANRMSSSSDSLKMNDKKSRIPNQITVDGRDVAKVVKWVGSGAFGSVYHVKSRAGKHYAMKSMDLQTQEKVRSADDPSSVVDRSSVTELVSDRTALKPILAFLDEISVSLLIPPHPNVAAVRYVCRSKFAKQSVVLAFSDFVNFGDLERHFSKPWDSKLFNGEDVDEVETLLVNCACQIFSGVSWLHSSNVIHQDLKPDNIMIDIVGATSEADLNRQSLRLRIADFGFATEGRSVVVPFSWYENWKDNSVMSQDPVYNDRDCPSNASVELVSYLHGCTPRYACQDVIERKDYLQQRKLLEASSSISSLSTVSTGENKLCGANRLVTPESHSTLSAITALVNAKESDVWSAALVCLQLFCRGWCPWDGNGGEAMSGLTEYSQGLDIDEIGESKTPTVKLTYRAFWTMSHDALFEYMKSDSILSKYADALPDHVNGWILGNSSDSQQELFFGVKKKADIIKLRKRLRKMFCYPMPDLMYNILVRCFDSRPWKRPSATEIMHELQQFSEGPDIHTRNATISRFRQGTDDEFSGDDVNLATSYYNLALSYSFHGFYSRSLQCYSKALQIRPNYAPAHYNKGILLQLAGFEDLATVCFKMAYDSDPHDFKAVFNYGVSMMSKARWHEARVMFQKSLGIQSTHIPSLQGLSRCIIIDGDIAELSLVYHRLAEADQKNASIAWREGIVDRLFSGRRSGLICFLRGCNCSKGRSLESLGFIGLEMLVYQDEGHLNVSTVDKTRFRIRSSVTDFNNMVSDGPILQAIQLARLGVESPFLYNDAKEIMKDMLCDMFQTLTCLEVLCVLHINHRVSPTAPKCLLEWNLTEVIESMTETCLMNTTPARKSIGSSLIAYCFASLATNNSLRIHKSMQQMLSSCQTELASDFQISTDDATNAGLICSEELLRLARYRCPDIETLVSDYFVAIGDYRLARNALTRALLNPEPEIQRRAHSRLTDLLELETSSFGATVRSLSPGDEEEDDYMEEDKLGEVVGLALVKNMKSIRTRSVNKHKLYGHAKRVIHRLLL